MTGSGKKQKTINKSKSAGKVPIEVMELNIQPGASILNVFSRLSYKPWYAIAEFVDNSTQSYLSHESEMQKIKGFDKLVVDIKYDIDANTLIITDNAYGMEIDRFKDAILLDSRNPNQSGRNEFGMGLKTAASWFGNVWHVTSTQYGSKNRYNATVDIPKLKEFSLNSIQINVDKVDPLSHGTIIKIEQVTKKITGPRTIGKIRDLLASMYRRDINNKSIEIWFNDELIVFEEYPVLQNFRGKTWKKDLDFIVKFDNKNYHVTGFVGIMNPGSFPKAGFALFRQDRVVVGGTDQNYKPAQIFVQSQSQMSLKLFGELNMNDFPVNQAKDGFIWDDGLEDAFILELKNNISEYIEIAKLSKIARDSETKFSEEASNELEKEVSNALATAFADSSVDPNESTDTTQNSDNTSNEVQEYIDTILHSNTDGEILEPTRSYHINLNLVDSIDFSVKWSRENRTYWIEYTEVNTNQYEVLINVDHPFFMPFSKEDGFQIVLEKFALAFILSERQAKLSSNREGYIPTNVIKNYMNKYLEKFAEN